MTYTEQDVERVVLEVIRRLGLLGTSPSLASEPSTDLQTAEKVITTRTIENRLTGVKRLIVQPRAIVTPAVRDQLQQQGIELVRQKP